MITTTTRKNLMAPLGLMLAALLFLAALAGCGDASEADSDTDARPVTTVATTETAADTGPSAEEVDIYVEQVRELVHSGDQLNAGYDDLTARFNAREVAAEEVITQAQQNAAAYGDMVGQLEEMIAPAGFGEAHALIISGFEKWSRMYDLDARAVRDQDSTLLDQARALDQAAVTEVNDAIDGINRLKG